MIFNSIEFLLFFPIVLLIYYVVPKKFRYIWLLICSYYFYLTQDTAFVSLLILTTLSTYLTGILLGKTSKDSSKKIILALCIILNMGIFAYFKYYGLLSLYLTKNQVNLALPIGISFYTFQATSYIIDCYRGKNITERNILKYALYVSFFPSILSGPINKSYDFLKELSCDSDFSLDNLKEGMMKMLWGYFLKLVIAARLTIVVDNVYAEPQNYGGASLLLAAIFFLFMLYCDFAGYSCIVIGASKMLGITMKENFLMPFFSLSYGELWKRWHVSLSSWLREYIYYPLGGNRKGVIRKYINMMIIFIISGIWHGSTMNFFVWGILNGLFLVIGNVLMSPKENFAKKIGMSKHPKLQNTLKRIGVYLLYGFTMIFFATDTMDKATGVISGIFTRFSISGILNGELFGLGLGVFNLGFSIILAIGVLIADGYCYKNSWDIVEMIKKMPTFARWILYLGLVTMILLSANLTGTEFIYSKM